MVLPNPLNFIFRIFYKMSSKTRWILNRAVRIDGQLAEAGTPLDSLPADAQTSIRDSGWVTEEVSVSNKAAAKAEADRKAAAEAAKSAGETNQAKPETNQPSSETNQAQPETNQAQPETNQAQPETNQAQPETNQAQPETNQAQPETNQAQPETTGDNRPLSDLGIDADKLALLAANDPPITTVQQALDHLAINKSFRTVTGIGKAGHAELVQKLGL